MGKRKRINRLITKWIKSDLPEDRSTVLLLGVTRIPTSPTPVRRPCSLPLTSSNAAAIRLSSPDPHTDNPHRDISTNTISTTTSSPSLTIQRDTNPNHVLLKENNNEQEQFGLCGSSLSSISSSSSSNNQHLPHTTTTTTTIATSTTSTTTTPSTSLNVTREIKRTPLLMDQSVDSIGTCSLDIDASFDLPEWSEASSLRTLRSESIQETETTPQETQKLPSYLSLACTVNGYSSTINYDPERLARSRDTSPHRLHDHDIIQHQPIVAYTIHNNLLSPPNLVPLPTATTPKTFHIKTKDHHHQSNAMAEQTTTITTHHHQEFYSSTKNMSYINKETHNFSSSIFSTDSVDACLDNNRKNLINNKSYENNKSYSYTNNQSNDATTQIYSKVEDKSFIEQRIERLYGPGALAHGFLVMKKHNRSFEMDKDEKTVEHHSKSMLDKLVEDDSSDGPMKQSTSFPTLPVMRHLRPEFRAQLPIISPKKNIETISKSNTIPIIKEECKTNGHSDVKAEDANVHVNGNKEDATCIDKDLKTSPKDGHYFIEILENEAKRLLVLAEEAEKELEDDNLSEEAKGYLRSTSGKAKLLVSQKMQQFKGLCTKNITQVEGEAFPTTNEDLQGFWDMVMLQVDQVDTLFKELKTLKANNWQEKLQDEVDKPKSKNGATNNRIKKIAKCNKPSAEAEEARRQREIQRKQMIEARRKAMREQKQNLKSSQQQEQQQNIEIFVPESS